MNPGEQFRWMCSVPLYSVFLAWGFSLLRTYLQWAAKREEIQDKKKGRLLRRRLAFRVIAVGSRLTFAALAMAYARLVSLLVANVTQLTEARDLIGLGFFGMILAIGIHWSETEGLRGADKEKMPERIINVWRLHFWQGIGIPLSVGSVMVWLAARFIVF